MTTFADFYENNRDRFLQELSEFLSIKSISTSPEYKDEINRAIKWLQNKLKSLGFTDIKTLKPSNPKYKDGNPVVYGEYIIDKNLPTILVYGHYDVQPADPLELWHSEPFNPVIKDGKIIARGANDNKGQLYTNLIAMEYYIKHIPDDHKNFNIKIFYEGEEETGGETTDAVIESREFDKELHADYAYIADGPWIAKDKPTIVYSLRGIVYFDLFLKTLDKDVHSGIYGNVVLNAANLAGYVIFKLKDIFRNRVRIDKIYKDVRKVSNKEKELIKKASPSWQQIIQETGARFVTMYRCRSGELTPLALTGTKPSLDVHGIYSGYTEDGGLKTIIPAESKIKFSIRLVPNMSVEKTKELVEKYLKKIIPKKVDWKLNFLGGAQPYIMDPSDEMLIKLSKAFKTGFGLDPVIIPEGGTIGLVNTLAKTYNMKILMPNYGLPDDGLHSPNEKYNLSQLKGGAKSFISFLTN